MHTFALSAQLDSDLTEDNALLLILTALDMLFKILLRFANLALQDSICHKEFASKPKLDVFILAQLVQAV